MIEMYNVIVKLCKSIYDKFIDEEANTFFKPFIEVPPKHFRPIFDEEEEEIESIPLEKSINFMLRVPNMM